jgi:hypothetical protein
MPYIKLTDRPVFDTIIDGLVPKIRDRDRNFMSRLAANFVVQALSPVSYTDNLGPGIDDIVIALAKRVGERGDANYCLCRILLESMKPEKGWSYRSLSDVVMAADHAIDFVYDVQRTHTLSDAQMWDTASVLGDVSCEIQRRLLDPYEDTAILKNGDMACFDEPFAYKPLNMSGAFSSRAACGCVCDPCQCEPSDIVEDRLPQITEALTRTQYEAIDRKRRPPK